MATNPRNAWIGLLSSRKDKDLRCIYGDPDGAACLQRVQPRNTRMEMKLVGAGRHREVDQ